MDEMRGRGYYYEVDVASQRKTVHLGSAESQSSDVAVRSKKIICI